MKCEGVKSLYVDAFGNLRMNTQLAYIIDSELLIFQVSEFSNNLIKGKFKIIDSFTYGFELFDDYNKKSDLIIDPLIYSTCSEGDMNC